VAYLATLVDSHTMLIAIEIVILHKKANTLLTWKCPKSKRLRIPPRHFAILAAQWMISVVTAYSVAHSFSDYRNWSKNSTEIIWKRKTS
jgi:hypothetical protein